MGKCWSGGTKFQLCMINKFWRPDVQPCDSINNSVLNTWNLLKRVDLKYSKPGKKKKVTTWDDGYVN